jgi:hypothetical protein
VPRISDEKILERILALKQNSSISPNVFSFVSSLAAGFKKYGGVTQKQYEAFCDVEESYLHTESKTSEWSKQYNDKHREIANICALYRKTIQNFHGEQVFAQSIRVSLCRGKIQS